MLNAKALSELFSRNRDERLCKRWYLMTPNGTLLAYSQPTDINQLRKQAAIAAITWQEHQSQDPANYLSESFHGEIREDAEQQEPLHVLTIESDTANVLLRQIQPQLLLVLDGGVPPRRPGFEQRITTESIHGTPQQWPHEPADGNSVRSNATGTNGSSSSSVAANVLRLQRAKLDALADAIIANFEDTGFKMPEDGGTTIF